MFKTVTVAATHPADNTLLVMLNSHLYLRPLNSQAKLDNSKHAVVVQRIANTLADMPVISDLAVLIETEKCHDRRGPAQKRGPVAEIQRQQITTRDRLEDRAWYASSAAILGTYALRTQCQLAFLRWVLNIGRNSA